jgi:hypothetical protein
MELLVSEPEQLETDVSETPPVRDLYLTEGLAFVRQAVCMTGVCPGTCNNTDWGAMSFWGILRVGIWGARVPGSSLPLACGWPATLVIVGGGPICTMTGVPYAWTMPWCAVRLSFCGRLSLPARLCRSIWSNPWLSLS